MRADRQLTPTPEDQRCWLIWSNRWGRWHRRGAEGGANGYTSDIAEAGLFPFSIANDYHDGVDDEAFHASDLVEKINPRMLALISHRRNLIALGAAALGETPSIDIAEPVL